MTRRPVRLTSAEWSALVSAVDEAQIGWADQLDASYERRIAAADRALSKVRDALTTPAVRR